MIIRHILQQRHILGAKHEHRLQAITSGKVLWLILLCFSPFVSTCFAIVQEQYVDKTFSKGSFALDRLIATEAGRRGCGLRLF
jgi:hypothetical protein